MKATLSILIILLGCVYTEAKNYTIRLPTNDGGTLVNIGSVPNMVALIKENSPFCGGSIITSNSVLTAAHCLNGRNATSIIIVVGQTDITAETIRTAQTHKVVKAFPHPQFDYLKMLNDIAILLISDDFHFNYQVQPIAFSEQPPPVGAYATASKWGSQIPGMFARVLGLSIYKDLSLKELVIPIISIEQCKKAYVDEYQILENEMFCVEFPKEAIDFAKCDAGGPVVYNKTQIGVVSFVDPHHPGVMRLTRVDSYKNWIREVLAQENHNTCNVNQDLNKSKST